MSNEYKRTLQRFEDAVRACERAELSDTSLEAKVELVREYECAKFALRQKLQYRALAAEQRADGRDWASGIDKGDK